MTTKQLKNYIDKTGEALLTLYNNNKEFLVAGNIDSMFVRNGRLVLKWRLPSAAHSSAFDRVMIHQTSKGLLWTDTIKPLRVDQGGSGQFRMELDYEV